MLHAIRTPEFDDEFETLLPGGVLTHLLTIVSQDQLGVGIEALVTIRAFGGKLDALHLTCVDGKTEQRLSVAGIRSFQARHLCARLANLPGVERASVEHRISSRSRPR